MIATQRYELDRLAELAATLQLITTERNARIRQLADSQVVGITAIAEAAGLSRTRVYQLLKEETRAD